MIFSSKLYSCYKWNMGGKAVVGCGAANKTHWNPERSLPLFPPQFPSGFMGTNKPPLLGIKEGPWDSPHPRFHNCPGTIIAQGRRRLRREGVNCVSRHPEDWTLGFTRDWLATIQRSDGCQRLPDCICIHSGGVGDTSNRPRGPSLPNSKAQVLATKPTARRCLGVGRPWAHWKHRRVRARVSRRVYGQGMAPGLGFGEGHQGPRPENCFPTGMRTGSLLSTFFVAAHF